MSNNYYDGSEFNNGVEHPVYSDRPFIDSELKKVPFKFRDKIMSKYSETYAAILENENIAKVKRVNIARRECNTRLRAAIININKTTPLSSHIK